MVNGELFDIDEEWVFVGIWIVVSDMVCYCYLVLVGMYCFDVFECNEIYYFYLFGIDNFIVYFYKVEKWLMM